MVSAPDIQRGVTRALIDADHAVMSELLLGNGRRADLATVERAGRITLVEIKSCRADFFGDGKWREYLGYCDRFYFAVGSDFPCDLLPADEGLILADRFEGAIISRPRDGKMVVNSRACAFRRSGPRPVCHPFATVNGCLPVP